MILLLFFFLNINLHCSFVHKTDDSSKTCAGNPMLWTHRACYLLLGATIAVFDALGVACACPQHTSVAPTACRLTASICRLKSSCEILEDQQLPITCPESVV
jgi:hypothetical protein